MNLKTNKEIPYYMHESMFIDHKIEKNNLIFRVAINCALVEELGIECDYGEKYYLYDIICHNYNSFKIDEDSINLDLLLASIVHFIYDDSKNAYSLLISTIYENSEVVHELPYIYIIFTFDCESIEWAPLKLMTIDELDSEEIENWRFK